MGIKSFQYLGALMVGSLFAAATPAFGQASPTARWGESDGRPAWTEAAYQAVTDLGSGLWEPGFTPADIDQYCPAFRAADTESRKLFWVGLLSALARPESDFDPTRTYTEKTIHDAEGRNVVSRGLLQLSIESANGYGCAIGDPAQLYDPRTNIRCAVRILDRLVPRARALARPPTAADPRWRGAAAYWRPVRTVAGVSEISGWTSRQPYCAPALAPLAMAAPPPPIALAAPPPPPPPVEYNAEATLGSPAGASAEPGPRAPATSKIDIVRYVGVDASGWPQDVKRNDLADLYTRVVVDSTDVRQGAPQTHPGEGGLSPDTRDYAREKRTWIERLFFSRTSTLTTVARLEVKDPALETTAPLFSISHASATGTGEVFVTRLTSTYVESPLFRLDPNTTLTIHLNTRLSDKAKSQVAAQLLGTVQEALKIAAPQSALLTTLSKPEIGSRAQALDTAISGLLSEDITEDIQVGRFADSWRPGARIEVVGMSPSWLTRTLSRADRTVGTWNLRLRCPRLSAFDPEDICDEIGSDGRMTAAVARPFRLAIAGRVDDQTALKFPLSSQVTVEHFIQTQTWFTPFVQKTSKSAADDHDFCLSLISSLYGAGLSHLDTAIVLRAAIDQIQGLGDSKARGAVAGACATLVADQLTLAPAA